MFASMLHGPDGVAPRNHFMCGMCGSAKLVVEGYPPWRSRSRASGVTSVILWCVLLFSSLSDRHVSIRGSFLIPGTTTCVVIGGATTTTCSHRNRRGHRVQPQFARNHRC